MSDDTSRAAARSHVINAAAEAAASDPSGRTHVLVDGPPAAAESLAVALRNRFRSVVQDGPTSYRLDARVLHPEYGVPVAYLDDPEMVVRVAVSGPAADQGPVAEEGEVPVLTDSPVYVIAEWLRTQYRTSEIATEDVEQWDGTDQTVLDLWPGVPAEV